MSNYHADRLSGKRRSSVSDISEMTVYWKAEAPNISLTAADVNEIGMPARGTKLRHVKRHTARAYRGIPSNHHALPSFDDACREA